MIIWSRQILISSARPGRDYMIKNVALVSLSAGTIGEDFVKHEVNIGLKRLEEFGLNVKVMPHAMKEMSM